MQGIMLEKGTDDQLGWLLLWPVTCGTHLHVVAYALHGAPAQEVCRALLRAVPHIPSDVHELMVAVEYMQGAPCTCRLLL